VIQRGGVAGLAQQAVAGRPGPGGRPEHFESDLSMERRVVRRNTTPIPPRPSGRSMR
jgi:hypothetical protein